VSPQDDGTAQGPDGGSRAANQGKTEPMPPTGAHDDPVAAPGPTTVERPDLDSMNVGAADPQAPSHPSAGAVAGAGFTEPEPTTRGASGPAQGSTGMAFRAPGSDGSGPDGEQIDTDVERSAARTNVVGAAGTPSGPGDAAGVPVVSDQPSPGTSQDSGQAQGSRTPL
jgi:hypothetical protein